MLCPDIIKFRTNTSSRTIKEQTIILSEKTTTVYSRKHKDGTTVITASFHEAMNTYMMNLHGVPRAVSTDYVDVDLVLAIYNDIINHPVSEEELLASILFG